MSLSIRKLLIDFVLDVSSKLPVEYSQNFIKLFLLSLSRRLPREALRQLFSVDTFLQNEIDRCAIAYESGIHPKHRLTAYHDFFVSRIQRGESVLDIGCGYGAVAASMAKAGARVTGVDISMQNIAEARHRYPMEGLTFICADATAELPAGRFDTVVASNVIEHIEQRADFIRSVQKLASPRRWLIRVPLLNRHWSVPMRRELSLPYYSDSTHFTEYTPESFSQELLQAELVAIHIQQAWGEIWAEVVPQVCDHKYGY